MMGTKGVGGYFYWRSTGISLLLLLILFYLPLLHFFSLAGLSLHLGVGDTSAIWFTLWQGICVSAISSLLALTGALLLYSKKFLGVRVLRTVAVIPFFIPGISIAIGFHELAHWPIYSFLVSSLHPVVAVIFAEVLVNVPVGIGLLGITLSSMNREVQEAIRVDGATKYQEFKFLTLPHLSPSIKRTFIITFFYSLSNLGIILAIGNQSTSSIESQIYSLIQGNLEIHQLATLAIIQSIISIALFLFITGKGPNFNSQQEIVELPSGRKLAPFSFIFIGFVTLPFLFPPIKFVCRAFFHEGSFFSVVKLHPTIVDTSLTAALAHTVRNALIAATFGVLISLGLSLGISRNSTQQISRRYRNLWGRIVEAISMLPLAFSPLLIGLGFLLTFTSGVFPLRESWIATPIAQALLGVPLAISLIIQEWKDLPKQYYEEGVIAGADSLTYFMSVELPLLRPVIVKALSYLSLISIADFSAAAFLSIGHEGVLTTIFQELISHPGADNFLSAEFINFFFIVISTSIIFSSEFYFKKASSNFRN